jgi:translation initiation factor 1 (eIF-1/SUI1)
MGGDATTEDIKCCPKCRLPYDLCRHINSETSTVTLQPEKRNHGKNVLIINGIKINSRALGVNESKDSMLESIASTLKSSLCCGGTVKDGKIMLQTKDAESVKTQLEEDFGFNDVQVL